MASTQLVSAFAMGLVLLAIAIGIARGRTWRRPPTDGEALSEVASALRSPMAWVVGFVVLALGIGLVAIAFVGGETVPISEGLAGALLVGALVGLLSLFLAAGAYAAARARGLPNSQAAGIGSIVLGALLLVGITFRLVFA